MGGRVVWEALIGVGAVGIGKVILIAGRQGIGKKVLKKIYGLDRSYFFIENCVLRYVVINCCVMCLK